LYSQGGWKKPKKREEINLAETDQDVAREGKADRRSKQESARSLKELLLNDFDDRSARRGTH
jgi:hypothetical protein